MGHPRDRRDGRLRRLASALVGAALALSCLVAPVGAGSPNEAAASALQELAQHCARYLPDLDLSGLQVTTLVERVKDPDESQDALRTELLKALKGITDQAKAEVLRKIKAVASDLAGTPTEPGNYEYRRQLVLTFDKIERAAGRRPGYPRELGRPFVTLVERPSPRELEKLDGFLRYLSKVKPPEVGGGGGISGGGTSEVAEDPEAPEESGSGSGSGSRLGPVGGGHGSGTGTGVRPGSSGGFANRGWMLVRYYVLGVVGAIVLLYLLYVGYTAAKGGRSLLESFRQLLKWRPGGTPEPEEDPFQKGMRLFQRNKYRDAIPVFEALAEEARLAAHPARYYLLLAALKENKTGLISRHFDKLNREKFSPDELYRLATALEAAGDLSRAKALYRYLHEKDSSFRDVAQRLQSDQEQT